MKKLRGWEDISPKRVESLVTDREYQPFISYRLEVPNGWIVLSTYSEALNQIFVEDKDHQWEIQY
jgi:hypothetical protein